MIEGTSPPNENDPKNKKESKSDLPDISNKIETIIGQQPLTSNDLQIKDHSILKQIDEINSKSSQMKNDIDYDNNKVEGELESNQKNSFKDEENKNKKDTNQPTNNDNNSKENDQKDRTTDDNNSKGDTNVGSENDIERTKENDDMKEDEKIKNDTIETNMKNSFIIIEKNDGKNEKNENKTEGIDENTINNENSKNEKKTDDEIKNNDENKGQLNEEENQQLINNSNDDNLLSDKVKLNSDRSTNSNTSNKSHFSSKPISLYFTKPDPKEVEDALESLIAHKTQPVEQLRDPVMQLINRKKLDALIDRDYDQAERYDQTAEILQKNGDDIIFERNERIRKNTIDDRAETITEKKNNLLQKYNNKIDDLKSERKTALETLQTQQEDENTAFRQKWKDPNFLSKYKRPSQELLHLRYVEKKLALSKFYDEAKEKKAWADKQQKIEEKQTQLVIEEEMKKDFFRMKDAQLFQLQKVAGHYDNLIKSVELQRNKEVQSLEYALKQMEVKRNTVPNRKLHTIPKELTIVNETFTDTSLTSKMSPRTLSKLAKFRNEKKGNINVNPIAESTFSKLIAAHPIVRPQSKFKVNNHPPSRLRRL